MEKTTQQNTNSQKSHNKTLLYVIAGAALIFSVTSLTFSALDYFSGDKPITFNGTANDGNSASFTDGSIEEVVNKVSPSVVSILTETRTNSWYGQSSTSTAAGSGMIISSDGYVLTNKHVISGANNVNVILDDGTTYEDVKVVATDPLNDVAFLKIQNLATELPAVTLGDSKTLNSGQQVVAIGNALGQYSNSVTFGVISGTGRSLTATDESYTVSETLTDMIQTDAAINAGNSGGPLVNAAAQVIGINTATSSGNDIGFAIPISSVKGMLSQVLKGDTAKRAYLGVYTIAVNKEVAKEYSLSVDYGALVRYKSNASAVLPDSPAATAGVKDGDVILSINGTKIGSAGSVSSIIGEYAPGDTVQLEINRNGQNMALNVTLGAYQSNS